MNKESLISELSIRGISLTEEQINILKKNGRLIAPTDTLKSYWPNNYDRETAGYPSD